MDSNPSADYFLKPASAGTENILLITRADSGTRFQIQFDGIFRNAAIWINGFYLGTNLSGYIGVAYDITDYVRFDRDNVAGSSCRCHAV